MGVTHGKIENLAKKALAFYESDKEASLTMGEVLLNINKEFEVAQRGAEREMYGLSEYGIFREVQNRILGLCGGAGEENSGWCGNTPDCVDVLVCWSEEKEPKERLKNLEAALLLQFRFRKVGIHTNSSNQGLTCKEHR